MTDQRKEATRGRDQFLKYHLMQDGQREGRWNISVLTQVRKLTQNFIASTEEVMFPFAGLYAAQITTAGQRAATCAKKESIQFWWNSKSRDRYTTFYFHIMNLMITRPWLVSWTTSDKPLSWQPWSCKSEALNSMWGQFSQLSHWNECWMKNVDILTLFGRQCQIFSSNI